MKKTLFSMAETARICEVPPTTLAYHRQIGRLPEPALTERGRRFYTAEQVAFAKAHLSKPLHQIRSEAGEIAIHKAASILHVSASTLHQLIADGAVIQPRLKGRRRHYSREDLEVLRAQLAAREPLRRPAARAKAAGLYTITASAERLRMPLITLTSWICKKWVPRPTRVFEGLVSFCYSEEDLKEIRVTRREYFARRLPIL